MRKNKHSFRSLTAFLVTWAFIVLTITGIILYIVPQGRVAYWIQWSFIGMEKDQWGWVHMMFGGVFIFTGFLHLYFNWKPFKNYFADRVKGHLALKREVLVATVITAVIFLVSVLNIPPASWVIDLNGWIKGTWVTSPELEPPYGHAEEASLAGISRKMGFDIDRVINELKSRGINFSGKRDTLEKIAIKNHTTPMAIYEIIRVHKAPVTDQKVKILSVDDIEAKFSGTGIGRKTIAEICLENGIDLEQGLKKLSTHGIPAKGKDKARALADKHDRTPIELLKILMLPS